MVTTPTLWLPEAQVNTTDAAFNPIFPDEVQVTGLWYDHLFGYGDTRHVVAWTDWSGAYNPSGRSVVAREFDRLGHAVTAEVKISQFSNGDQHIDSIAALTGGNVAIAFSDGYADNPNTWVSVRNSSLGLIRNDPIDVSAAYTARASLTGLNNGGYVVAYEVKNTDTDIDVVARVVDANGTVGAQFDLQNETDSSRFAHLATLTNGNWVAVTESQYFGSTTDTDVFYQIRAPGGTLLKSLITVTGAGTNTIEDESDVAALAGGGFVVTWTFHTAGNTDSGIQATVFDAAGNALHTGIGVNTTGLGHQFGAHVTGLADGGFFVSWGDDQVGVVRGQRFDEAGGKIGTEVLLRNGFIDARDVTLTSDDRIVMGFGYSSTGDPDVTHSIWDPGVGAGRTAFNNAAPAINSFGFDNSAGGWKSFDHFPRVLADVNGDGRDDLVGFGGNGVFVATSKGNGQFNDPVLAVNSFGADPAGGGWSSDNTFHRELANVNGDSRADIVGFGGDGVYVALANGPTSFAPPTLAINAFGTSGLGGSWTTQDQQPRMTADVNGDGFADLVGFHSTGVFISLGNGTGGFGAPVYALHSFGANVDAGGWTSDSIFHREMADVNGDGRDDIVGFGGNGVFVALANPGGLSFGSPILAVNSFGFSPAGGSWLSQGVYPRMMADVNGDHFADIVGFGDDSVWVSIGQGDGTFGTPYRAINSFGASAAAGSWTSQEIYPRQLGDVDGDHLADLVGFGSYSTFVALANHDQFF